MSKESDFIELSEEITELLNNFEDKYAPSYEKKNTYEYMDAINIVRFDGFGRKRSRIVGLEFKKSLMV